MRPAKTFTANNHITCQFSGDGIRRLLSIAADDLGHFTSTPMIPEPRKQFFRGLGAMICYIGNPHGYGRVDDVAGSDTPTK